MISSTALKNDASLALEGLLNPVIFLTNWSAADWISSSVMGGSKLKRVLIFLHMHFNKSYFMAGRPAKNRLSFGSAARPGRRSVQLDLLNCWNKRLP